MFISKLWMDWLPNIHLLGVFTIAITVVYRQKALYAIYTYVLLNGVFAGFSAWWIPHLYLWTLLCLATMLLPKQIPPRVARIFYMSLCGLHGLLYGVLYAPCQAFFFGLNFEQTIAWVVAGLPFDLLHGISNFIAGLLISPIISLLKKLKP